MAKYLVTGAAGFIGGAVAEFLIERGDVVYTIDNLSTGFKERIPAGVVFIQGDVFDPTIINKLNNVSFDGIIHMAGQSSGEISFENPVYDLNTNAVSTLLLLDFAREHNVKKFVYASSMSVYGDLKTEIACEKDDTKPKSFYAVGKIASENYMRIYSDYGIDCTALRFFNVYGIGQNMDNMKQGMASIFLASALRDRKIVVKGSKDRFRDFVYIDDVVNSVIMALDKMNSGYHFYNVATGDKTKVEEVVNSIVDNLETHVEVEYAEGTPGDQFGIYGNAKKIEQELGWKAKVSFEDGMKRMIRWAVENRGKNVWKK